MHTSTEVLEHSAAVQVGEEMKAKGWDFAFLIKPAALHFCFTLQVRPPLALSRMNVLTRLTG